MDDRPELEAVQRELAQLREELKEFRMIFGLLTAELLNLVQRTRGEVSPELLELVSTLLPKGTRKTDDD